METWEKRCWQCILLGYIVVPLLLLRLPTTSDIGDSYVQCITTVLSALGRAVVDTAFIHLLGGKPEVESILTVHRAATCAPWLAIARSLAIELCLRRCGNGLVFGLNGHLRVPCEFHTGCR